MPSHPRCAGHGVSTRDMSGNETARGSCPKELNSCGGGQTSGEHTSELRAPRGAARAGGRSSATQGGRNPPVDVGTDTASRGSRCSRGIRTRPPGESKGLVPAPAPPPPQTRPCAQLAGGQWLLEPRQGRSSLGELRAEGVRFLRAPVPWLEGPAAPREVSGLCRMSMLGSPDPGRHCGVQGPPPVDSSRGTRGTHSSCPQNLHGPARAFPSEAPPASPYTGKSCSQDP